jgi:hypothetical protein
MIYYCICGDEVDGWCPEHGDDVDDLRAEFGENGADDE